jgi:glycosyltransferase involved in cell wall biosynthesis
MLEAMATGLPCICTAVGGVPEWIRNGENGVLIPPKAPEALAEAILALARDVPRRKLFGTEARKTVMERGDWFALMARVERDYQEMIEKYA